MSCYSNEVRPFLAREIIFWVVINSINLCALYSTSLLTKRFVLIYITKVNLPAANSFNSNQRGLFLRYFSKLRSHIKPICTELVLFCTDFQTYLKSTKSRMENDRFSSRPWPVKIQSTWKFRKVTRGTLGFDCIHEIVSKD